MPPTDVQPSIHFSGAVTGMEQVPTPLVMADGKQYVATSLGFDTLADDPEAKGTG